MKMIAVITPCHDVGDHWIVDESVDLWHFDDVTHQLFGEE